jgi:hypothetical protein
MKIVKNSEEKQKNYSITNLKTWKCENSFSFFFPATLQAPPLWNFSYLFQTTNQTKFNLKNIFFKT